MRTSKWFPLALAAALGAAGLISLNSRAANTSPVQDRGALRGRFLDE